MRDKDGQIIESKYGSYDAKASLFVFNDQVNMYMDTTFVKTSRLEYRSDLNTAYFGYGTDMWQDDNMLSANDGWYDRNKELFFFRRDVHLLTKDQETWSDTLYYHRAVNDVELLGKVELMDTTRNVFALAGRVDYTDSLSRVKMTRTPAVMSVEEEKGKRDTTYIGADTLLYRGIKRHVVDSLWKVDADKRLKDLAGDPVTEYRRKAAEAAAKAAEEAAKNNPDAQAGIDRGPEGARPGARGGRGPATDGKAPPAGETGEKPDDPPATKEEPETGETPQDTVAVVPAVDTTQLSFIWAVNHVKLYREDMQMSCDSLAYNDLDSLVRLYRDPLVFNEGNRQYAADSIYVVIRNRKAERARLMSNAFITTQEDTVCFDQIKGTEMMAYFDSTRTLQRFDALGGATALFFLTENETLATVNKVESKMLYALFDGGNLDKIYYFDNAKNDAYPIVQLPRDERYMKGFRWDPDRKPRGRQDITPLVPRRSQRTSYLARPHAQFKETNIYFPGHINKIYKDIAERDSLSVLRARQPKEQPKATPTVTLPAAEDSLHVAQETLPAAQDSLLTPDRVRTEQDTLDTSAKKPVKEVPRDSTGTLVIPLDSLSLFKPAESEGNPSVNPPSEKELARAKKEEEKARKAEEKAARDAEKAAKAAEKKAAQEAKWAEKDKAYQEKQEAKAQKKLEKERKRKLRALQKLERKAQKERRIFERYLEQERARVKKKAAREAEKAARQAEKNRKKAEATDPAGSARPLP